MLSAFHDPCVFEPLRDFTRRLGELLAKEIHQIIRLGIVAVDKTLLVAVRTNVFLLVTHLLPVILMLGDWRAQCPRVSHSYIVVDRLVLDSTHVA